MADETAEAPLDLAYWRARLEPGHDLGRISRLQEERTHRARQSV